MLCDRFKKFHVDKEIDLYHQNSDTLLDIYEANLEDSIVIMYNYSDLFMYLTTSAAVSEGVSRWTFLSDDTFMT